MLNRRTVLAGATLAPFLLLAPRGRAQPADSDKAHKAAAEAAQEALGSSPLVYITPIKSDGEESRCKAEIWFAYHDAAVFVVTPATAWRAQAIGRGLTSARMWVGDFGVWTRADGAFREAPELMATGAMETNAETRTKVLAVMGEKYAGAGWGNWGPRFEKGLADGERVMLRYTPDG